MKQRKQPSTIRRLLAFAGKYKALTILGLILSGIAMALSVVPYLCIWFVLRDLLAVAPQWNEATGLFHYGKTAFLFAFLGLVTYFAALMCTHFAAFRTAANIRKQGMEHLMRVPLGFFDLHPSGFLRNRLDAGAADTETLLAHNLADTVGTVVLFITMVILLLAFDWRMGVACMLAAVISLLAMFSMMGGKNSKRMAEYQEALDETSKAATEYIRGIPVVKIFQQSIYTFRTFKQAIEMYSDKADQYQGEVCRFPQSVNLTFTKSAFVFLLPAAFLLMPTAEHKESFALFLTNFAFYAVFSALLSTALARIMFAAGGLLQADIAMSRIDTVFSAPLLPVTENPVMPDHYAIRFEDVSFTYPEAKEAALSHISFTANEGEKLALVGPSGGGKTTIASLIPRFWDVTSGRVSIGGIDVRQMELHVLMKRVAFVFQQNRLFPLSIAENVRVARPSATREEIYAALEAAQCKTIIEKLPHGMDTVLGTEGTYLSGGEQQRIAIARAILKDAPIVVLDEATAFADPENEQAIQCAFRSLLKNKTVLFIAHRLSTVVDADRILVIAKSQIAEEGKHQELIQRQGLYAKMWNDYQQSLQWKIGKREE